MNDNLDQLISRRSFLRQGTCAAMGLAGLSSQVFAMRSMGAVLDGHRFSDYKALVCIFMFGGNDSGNTIIPWDGGDENYANYLNERTTLALSETDLAPFVIEPENTMGRRFAMHPSLSGVRGLFNEGNAAIVSNVGTLVEPTTRSQFRSKSVAVPPQLFGHNTQQEQWQLSRPNVSDGLGWGGRIADALHAQGINPNATVSMNISLAGRSRFLAGREVSAYSIGTDGPPELRLWGAGDRRIAEQAFMDMLAVHKDPSHPASTPMGKVLSDVTDRSIANGNIILDLLALPSVLTAEPPATNLAAQLHAVARMIEIGRTGLSHQRQIFFVSLGGFDNHSGLLGTTPTTGPHGMQLAEVDGAMMYFWEALGQLGMRNNVTTFTASDFGRTYRSNGNGSDHGWGGHHIAMGGTQLRGRRMYGKFPSIELEGSQDSGSRGTFIPTTAVDEYGFEFARWMGVPASEMPTVFPNISRFLDVNNPSTHLGMLS
ncbi:MAG: DUF1501 domain-containing protein [Planctomycetota bacterium]